MQADFWNERYQTNEYVYGLNPNRYFEKKLRQLDPGILLLPAEGEGRNAVFAAQRGWEVFAFDQSSVARDKALRLARKKAVKLHYQLSDIDDFYTLYSWKFDAIGCFFVHLLPEKRRRFHQRLVTMLRPGGTLILQGFGKHQLEYSSGGPKDLSMLFDPEELKEDFRGLAILELKDAVEELNEGPGHQGQGHLVSLLARRPL